MGRLVLARIVDQVYVRRLAWLIMSLQTTALLAIALWPTAPVLIGASLVYGYGIGHVTTLGPVVVRREFGAAAFGATYGAAATVIQLTSAFGPALFGFLRDCFGGYGPGLMIAALVTALGGLNLFVGGRLRIAPRAVWNHVMAGGAPLQWRVFSAHSDREPEPAVRRAITRHWSGAPPARMASMAGSP